MAVKFPLLQVKTGKNEKSCPPLRSKLTIG